MFNYNHLYYFYVTALLGGVSNASKHLSISQPSLSAQIKTFEASIDRKLFEKSGRKMQLTKEGEQIYTYCRQMFKVADHLANYLKSPDQKAKRRIHIGVTDQIEHPFLADLLGDILEQGKDHINCTLNVSTDNEEQLLQKLKTQKVDLVLTNNPIQNESLHEIISVRMPVAMVISKALLQKHGYRKTPSFIELFKNDKIGLLLPASELRLRSEVDIFMHQKNVQKPILMESDILSVVARAVVDRGGCAFLPIPYIANEIKMKLVSVIGPVEGLWKHRLRLISRKQIMYDPLFEEIKNNLLELNRPVRT